MNIKAYAKINLGLDVIKRREDGYHEVRMIMQSIDLSDELIVEEKDSPGIAISTNNGELPVNEDNLIYKAAKLLSDEFGINKGVDIKLTKNIPIAAGLAGGSTDAAATMIALNELWDLRLSQKDLMSLSVKIGADVPYCIMGGTVIAEGIGEKLTPINNCPDCFLLIAKPPVGVSTKYVYQNLKIEGNSHPDIDAIISAIDASDIKSVANNLGNILESVTIPLHPVIDTIKNMMVEDGALGSLMSGSGPTIFGIFDNEELALKSKNRIEEANIAKDIVLTSLHHPRM